MNAISSAQSSLLLVEAARYALLRRLAYSIRHQMVVHLQPIGMVTELLERRLRSPTPDLVQVHDSVVKIQGLHKSAVHDCVDVISWMAPEPGATLGVDEALQDCMALMRSNLSFRGIVLRSEPAEGSQRIARAAGRMLLPAALLALTDPTEGPAEILLRGRADDDTVTIEAQWQRTEGDPPVSGDLHYRALEWREVEALARSEDVDLTHTESSATLVFPTQD